ncbi:MAG: gamma-glutamylcyclotransferase [Candidatus Micrarchaeota archaeon]|nr:gamma-glutamylcyclotransferase [Candidatus Micrarchaeota archaeon]
MLKYFAYGSNLKLDHLTKRIERQEIIKPSFVAVLNDHKLIFPRYSRLYNGGVASVKPSPNNVVCGAVFELTEKELKKLDRYEGFPSFYTRKKIRVMDLHGNYHDVITYIANEEGNYQPSRLYLDIIIQGAKECNLPKEYIAKLEQIETCDTK